MRKVQCRSVLSYLVALWLAAGKGIAGAGIVVPTVVAHTANQGVFVRHASQAGQMLGHEYSRNIRGNRFEFTADFAGGLWLRIKRINVAGAAELEEQNHAACPRFASAARDL